MRDQAVACPEHFALLTLHFTLTPASVRPGVTWHPGVVSIVRTQSPKVGGSMVFDPPDMGAPPSDANILARILARNASLLQCAGSGVFIWDEDKHSLTAMTPFVGLEDESVGGLEFPVGGSMLGGVVLHDRPALVDEMT